MKEVAKASRHPSDVSEHKRSICESNIHNPVLGRTTADVLKKDSMERTMLSVLDASTSNGHRDDPHWENVPRKSTTGSTMLFDGSLIEPGTAAGNGVAIFVEQGMTPFLLYEEQPEEPGEVMVFGVENESGDGVDKPLENSHQSTPSESSAENSKNPTESKRMRRQEQNRSSQRAFRLRRAGHVRGLQEKLGELHKTHRNLCQSYLKKCEQVDQLNRQVSELTAELLQLQTQLSPVPPSINLYPTDNFDTQCCYFTPIDVDWHQQKWHADQTMWCSYQY